MIKVSFFLWVILSPVPPRPVQVSRQDVSALETCSCVWPAHWDLSISSWESWQRPESCCERHETCSWRRNWDRWQYTWWWVNKGDDPVAPRSLAPNTMPALPEANTRGCSLWVVYRERWLFSSWFIHLLFFQKHSMFKWISFYILYHGKLFPL